TPQPGSQLREWLAVRDSGATRIFGRGWAQLGHDQQGAATVSRTLDAGRATAEKACRRRKRLWIEGADLCNEVSTWFNEGKGKLQQHPGWRGRPRDRPIELLPKRRTVAKLLRPPGGHGHVRQRQGRDHVLEEGALPGIRLQQGEMHLGHGERQGDRRQSAA